MPTNARGNANAPTLVIGDKGAHLNRGRAPLPGVRTAGPVGG